MPDEAASPLASVGSRRDADGNNAADIDSTSADAVLASPHKTSEIAGARDGMQESPEIQGEESSAHDHRCVAKDSAARANTGSSSFEFWDLEEADSAVSGCLAADADAQRCLADGFVDCVCIHSSPSIRKCIGRSCWTAWWSERSAAGAHNHTGAKCKALQRVESPSTSPMKFRLNGKPGCSVQQMHPRIMIKFNKCCLSMSQRSWR